MTSEEEFTRYIISNTIQCSSTSHGIVHAVCNNQVYVITKSSILKFYCIIPSNEGLRYTVNPDPRKQYLREKAFLTQRRAKCSMVTAQVYRLKIQIFKKAVKRFTNPVQSVNDMLNHFRCHSAIFFLQNNTVHQSVQIYNCMISINISPI